MSDVNMDALAEAHYMKHDPAFADDAIRITEDERLAKLEEVTNLIDQAMLLCVWLLDDAECPNIRSAYAALNEAYGKLYREM